MPLQGEILYDGDMGHKNVVGEVGTGPGGSKGGGGGSIDGNYLFSITTK